MMIMFSSAQQNDVPEVKNDNILVKAHYKDSTTSDKQVFWKKDAILQSLIFIFHGKEDYA